VGGALALDAAWLFAAFLVVLILAAASIAARRFLLERGGGTVECGLRRGDRPWRLGLASYQSEELHWFRVFGISMRPQETFPRHDLTLVGRRRPSDAEAASLGPGMIVVECQLGAKASPKTPAASAKNPEASEAPEAAEAPGATVKTDATVELALAESALTGLLSWLEASPPGSHR
jgi:hypothetical protein